MLPLDLDLALDTARHAAEAAGSAALRHFRTGVRVELKPDRTPVTIADREAEDAAVAVIESAFPGHGILGEETGAHGSTRTRWIIDPLDGTRGFTRGESCWGPLIALEHEGDVVAGAMTLPVTGEVFFAARGLGAWSATMLSSVGFPELGSPSAPTAPLSPRGGIHGNKGAGRGDGGEGKTMAAQPPSRLQVSGISNWGDATFSLGEPRILLAVPYAEAISKLATTCARTRCLGDLAGFAMVLKGQAEAWIEAGVQIWDLAPMKVLLDEAGGRFTDLTGLPTVKSGNALATNGAVHELVLATLGRSPGTRT